MSLKAFHVVFISLSILLLFVLSGWLVNQYLLSGRFLFLLLAALSFAAGLGLAVYERSFLKKTKNIPYL